MSRPSNERTQLLNENKKNPKTLINRVIDILTCNLLGGPTLAESIAHYLQILNLTHSPCNIFAYVLKPVTYLITLYQSKQANSGLYLYHQKVIHGNNFCAAGGLWMCDYEAVKRHLTEPQARAFKLAPSQLRKSVLPATKLGGRFAFLLSLSQEGAGGNGDWEAFRGCINDTIFTKDTKLRAQDDTSRKLIEKLTSDYKQANCAKDVDGAAAFFGNESQNQNGLDDFLLRYLHYVVFGINPFDESIINQLRDFHFGGGGSAGPHLHLVGQLIALKTGFAFEKQFPQIADILKQTESITDMNEHEPKYKNMTKTEIAGVMVSIMSLAGMVGPTTWARIALGKKKLPPYEGQTTGDIDVTDVWDTIDLNDRDEVKKYLHECGRLRHPVSNTHTVAQEDFMVEMKNKSVSFPKGTIIYIPMQLASIDESVYGDTTFAFNHKRKNLCPFSTIFHSVGESTNGRICPGRHVAENMMIDVMIALGRARREK
mmetsp:Transcript_31068/g.53139  ORF Transcript_31068/g.53139 Transcript_31068/m.53139 type:complete len:485 (-) Transcript_31068:21-1475(-)